jgi:hypothetical protein
MILSKIDLVDEAIHRVCNYFFTNLLNRTGLLHDVRNEDTPHVCDLNLKSSYFKMTLL